MSNTAVATEIVATVNNAEVEDLVMVIAHITRGYSVTLWDIEEGTIGGAMIFPDLDRATDYALAQAS
jgi:hypothetical protein